MSVFTETMAAVEVAREQGLIGPLDAGTVSALLHTARKIDEWDVIVRWASEDAGGDGRPKVPTHDNVSISAYLKYCDALGLTPEARAKLEGAKARAKAALKGAGGDTGDGEVSKRSKLEGIRSGLRPA